MKFADTSWWVAWSMPADDRHSDALSLLRHVGASERVLSTNHVISETWTVLSRKLGHRAAVAFLDRVAALEQANKLTLHQVTAEQEKQAWAWLRDHDERSYSFVDATSFATMRDRRLREALAFDQDFAAAGFIELQP